MFHGRKIMAKRHGKGRMLGHTGQRFAISAFGITQGHIHHRRRITLSFGCDLLGRILACDRIARNILLHWRILSRLPLTRQLVRIQMQYLIAVSNMEARIIVSASDS